MFISEICLQCIGVLVGHNLFTKSLDLLSSEQNMRIVFNTLEGNYALCLLANLIQLAYVQREDALKDLAFPTFTVSNAPH
jgi:ubiquitin-protein ligase E3 B